MCPVFFVPVIHAALSHLGEKYGVGGCNSEIREIKSIYKGGIIRVKTRKNHIMKMNMLDTREE